MTFNHLKLMPKGKIIPFVPIANIYFNWSVWGFGKDFPVGLPEADPISTPVCRAVGARYAVSGGNSDLQGVVEAMQNGEGHSSTASWSQAPPLSPPGLHKALASSESSDLMVLYCSTQHARPQRHVRASICCDKRRPRGNSSTGSPSAPCASCAFPGPRQFPGAGGNAAA